MRGKFNPSHGGHAPDHLRSTFEDWIIESVQPVNSRWLIGQLWNCTDIMPGHVCNDLELVQGSTYSQGVRKIKND